MITNDLTSDVQELFYQARISKTAVARELDVALPSLSRAIAIGALTPMIIDAIDALGYDIELTYVKKGEQKKETLSDLLTQLKEQS